MMADSHMIPEVRGMKCSQETENKAVKGQMANKRLQTIFGNAVKFGCQRAVWVARSQKRLKRGVRRRQVTNFQSTH